MKRAVLYLLLSTLALVAAPGLRPRTDANSYTTHVEQADFSIGAALIPPDRVKKMFKLDLSHAGYVVIEVGVFPAPGKDVDLSPGDFTLYVVGDTSVALRSVSADTIAEGVANRSHQQPRLPSPLPANTSIGASVSNVSFPGGSSTETDVGVGIGGPAPQPCRAYGCDQNAPDRKSVV